MIDFIIAYPYLLGLLSLPVLWLAIVLHHYQASIRWWWKLVLVCTPMIGLIARIKRRPGCVRILNPGHDKPVCTGEVGVVMPFHDELTARLSPERWKDVSTFLTRSGDSELSGVLRAPPTRALAKTTILFIEAYAVSLLLAPKLSELVTPEQVPLMAFGAGIVLAVVLSALLNQGGKHSRLVQAFDRYMRSYASDPQSGEAQPRPINWDNDQSVDDDRPTFQMGLARLKDRGNRWWVIAALLGTILTVAMATGLRYSAFATEEARAAAHARELAYERGSTEDVAALQKRYEEANRLDIQFALAIFLLSFGLSAVLTFVDARDRTALGRGVPELLRLTRGCASFEEEASLLRRSHATVSKILGRLQREMPPFPRPTLPSIYDVLKYIAKSSESSAQGPGSPSPLNTNIGAVERPATAPAAFNIAQLPTRREFPEKPA